MDAKHEQSPEYARIGSTLENRYRILDVLAQGGMGVVYRGERLGLNRTVAVKFLHASFAANAQARERFERELQAMSRLTHPNCVSVIDYGIADSPFIVMEYVTGRTLKDVLAEKGPLQPVRALYIASQILAALAHAHSQDMVHRDIKPANIILADVEGTLDHVYVLDFGLAKFMSGAAKDDLTASWMVLGTPAYMSPEQGRGESIGAATDIYATGVVLFELLTGTKPYNADNPIDTIHQHQFAPLPSIRDRLPEADFSAELDEAIRTALAKDPGQRFASAQIFAEALDFVPEAAPTRTSTRLRALTAPPGRGRAESTQLGSSDAVSQASVATSLLGSAPAPGRIRQPRRGEAHEHGRHGLPEQLGHPGGELRCDRDRQPCPHHRAVARTDRGPSRHGSAFGCARRASCQRIAYQASSAGQGPKPGRHPVARARQHVPHRCRPGHLVRHARRGAAAGRHDRAAARRRAHRHVAIDRARACADQPRRTRRARRPRPRPASPPLPGKISGRPPPRLPPSPPRASNLLRTAQPRRGARLQPPQPLHPSKRQLQHSRPSRQRLRSRPRPWSTASPTSNA